MISREQIDAVIARVREIGPGEEALKALRAAHPKIHFTYCSDDDVMGPAPVHEEDAFCLYLIDGREHCIQFTTNTETATGLVVAEVEPEEA